LFTVSLNNYTFFFKTLITGSRLKLVISLYAASTAFNVAVQYFPINSNEKLACVLYTSAYYMRDFTVVTNKAVTNTVRRLKQHLVSVVEVTY